MRNNQACLGAVKAKDAPFPFGVYTRHLTGGTWKARHFKKLGKASQTPGRKKVETCQADATKKFMAKVSKSYNDPGYSAWCRKMDSLNK